MLDLLLGVFGCSPRAAMKDSPFIHVRSQNPSSLAPQRSLREHEQRAYSVTREWRGEKNLCMCER